MKNIVRQFALFLLLPLVLTNCDQSHSSKSSDDLIVIGAIFSSTGIAGDYGKKSVQGLELAVDDINRNGGIQGKMLKVIVEDAKSSPKDALSAYRKLVDLHGVKFIIGDVYSSTTKTILDNLDSDVLLFAPGASKPDLVNLKQNFLRNWTSDDFDGLAMSNVTRDMGIEKISVLNQSSDYTISLSNAFIKDFKHYNGEITSHDEFTAEGGRYRELLIGLKNKGVENVYLAGLSSQLGQILKESSRIGYHPQWFTNLTVNTADCKNVAGESINGVIFTEPFLDKSENNTSWTEFENSYHERFGSVPDATVAHAYDAMKILELALDSTTKVNEVVSYINKLANYPGVSGNTTFDGHGGVVKDIVVKQFVDGSAIELKVFKFNE